MNTKKKSFTPIVGFAFVALACSGTPQNVCGTMSADGGPGEPCGGSTGIGGDTADAGEGPGLGFAGSPGAAGATGNAGAAGSTGTIPEPVKDSACIVISPLIPPPTLDVSCSGPLDSSGKVVNALAYYGRYSLQNVCSRAVPIKYWKYITSATQYIRQLQMDFSGTGYTYSTSSSVEVSGTTWEDVALTQPAIPANASLILDLSAFLCPYGPNIGDPNVIPPVGTSICAALAGFMTKNDEVIVSLPSEFQTCNIAVGN